MGVVRPTVDMKSSIEPTASAMRARFHVRGEVLGDMGLNTPGSGSSNVSMGIRPCDMPAPGMI